MRFTDFHENPKFFVPIITYANLIPNATQIGQ